MKMLTIILMLIIMAGTVTALKVISPYPIEGNIGICSCNGTGSSNLSSSSVLLLNQSTPQQVTNGSPIFTQGLISWGIIDISTLSGGLNPNLLFSDADVYHNFTNIGGVLSNITNHTVGSITGNNQDYGGLAISGFRGHNENGSAVILSGHLYMDVIQEAAVRIDGWKNITNTRRTLEGKEAVLGIRAGSRTDRGDQFFFYADGSLRQKNATVDWDNLIDSANFNLRCLYNSSGSCVFNWSNGVNLTSTAAETDPYFTDQADTSCPGAGFFYSGIDVGSDLTCTQEIDPVYTASGCYGYDCSSFLTFESDPVFTGSACFGYDCSTFLTAEADPVYTAARAGIYSAITGNITYNATSNIYIYSNNKNLSFNETKLNITIYQILNGSTFYPNTTQVIYGTNTTGNITLLWYHDSRSYNITEAAGLNPLEFRINYTNVTGLTQFIGRTYYSGSTAHTLEIDLYDYISSSWETYTTFTAQSGFIDINFPIHSPAEHINNGIVQLRFLHLGSGVAGHILRIDQAILNSGVAAGGGGGSSGDNLGNHEATQNLNMTTYNITTSGQDTGIYFNGSCTIIRWLTSTGYIC